MEQNSQTYAKYNLDTPANASRVQQDIQLLPLSHLMAQHFPPIEWWVDGLIPEDAVVLLSGAPASFKTWFVLEMVKSVTAGEKFLGQFNTKPTNVLIMDAESGERQLYDHFTKLNINPESKVYYHCCDGIHLNRDFMIQLEAECWANDIRLVIFDSLVRFHNGDENSARDMSRVFKNFSYLKNHGITSLVLHHTRKGGNNGQGQQNSMEATRGSSDIPASCDVQLSILRSRRTNQVVIEQIKNRFNPEGRPFTASFVKEGENRSNWYFGRMLESKEDLYERNIELVSNFIKDNPGKNQKEILAYLQARDDCQINSDKPLRDILVQLEDKHVITSRHGKGKALLYYMDDNINGESQNA